MQMYEVVAVSDDMEREIAKEILYAQDEDDAIDQFQELMKERKIACGICMAQELQVRC